jgi:hypothetical protein
MRRGRSVNYAAPENQAFDRHELTTAGNLELELEAALAHY